MHCAKVLADLLPRSCVELTRMQAELVKRLLHEFEDIFAVQEMEPSGVIEPASGPCLSPVMLVRKKDNSWHFCVD